MAVSSNTECQHGDQATVSQLRALAREVARDHVRWCIADGWTLAEVILRAGQPLPGHRRAIWFEDALAAVALAWLMLEVDAMSEAA